MEENRSQLKPTWDKVKNIDPQTTTEPSTNSPQLFVKSYNTSKSVVVRGTFSTDEENWSIKSFKAPNTLGCTFGRYSV